MFQKAALRAKKSEVAAFFVWLDQNWFNLLQSIGISGSLLVTTAALRRDKRSRDITERLQLLEQHRELWEQVYERPELKRVKEPHLDLVGEPISTAEREFMNLIIVHFETGWRLAQLGSVNSLETIRTDVRTFFGLPIPRAIWAESKDLRDKDFRHFVDKCLGAGKN